jgi:hypothetical protein
MSKVVTLKIAGLTMLWALAMPTYGQTPGALPNPQTARQALMEMFFSKTPGTFIKHLPATTLAALENAGALKTLQQYSALASQFHTTGNQLETFESGSVLLSTVDPKTNQKVDVVVENDSLQGGDDNIELSFRTYKDKQLQRTPFMPRLTFAMKMESGIWKLNEILISVRVPLADPDFLKSITDGIKSRAAAATAVQSQTAPSTINFGADSSIVAAMRTILTAENTYRNTYGSVGYTCTLSDLDGFGSGEANEHQAMLISSGLASGKKFGYVFTLSGCAGAPATSFHLSATTSGNAFGRRNFCADQLGVIRSSTDSNPANCFATGTPLP